MFARELDRRSRDRLGIISMPRILKRPARSRDRPMAATSRR